MIVKSDEGGSPRDHEGHSATLRSAYRSATTTTGTSICLTELDPGTTQLDLCARHP